MCYKTHSKIENILNILSKHSGRKGNLPRWDSNPMPLVCRTSALPLDHRGFQFCLSLIQVIYCEVTAVTIIIYKTSSVHPIRKCVTTAHLFRASVWMAYHHLNNDSQVFSYSKMLSMPKEK